MIRPHDLAALRVEYWPQAGGATARCTVSNLPIGRKLPLDFAIRLGDGTPAACANRTDYTTHTTTGECTVSTAGQTGVQPVAIRLGSGDWRTVTTVDLRPLDLTQINPSWSFTSGGAQVTLRG